MKRLLFYVIFLFSMVLSSSAQEWSVTLSSVDGLPGVEKDYEGSAYYEFTSTLLEPGVSTDKVRMTVVGTMSNEAPNGNNITFALSGLKIYDRDGMIVPYTASSNADHNTLSWSSVDGAGLYGLSDNNVKTYFHSMWSSYNAVSDYHYVELTLDRSVDAFFIEWSTRLGEPKNSPFVVGITLGTDYATSSIGKEFALGNAVTFESELAVENQLFVLQSNAVKSFVASNGTAYYGSGPLYMQYAEKGDVEPSVEHVMQLIPAGDGRYLVYWPVSDKFLENSASLFNGANGWQYSTSNFESAASVKIAATGNGYFEMEYDGENSAGDLTLYVAAEMRDGTISKMKTFDLPHKQALEKEDYTQGFALPAAFNWSIYKANLNASTVEELMVTVPQLAQVSLNPIINNAGNYLAMYGNHDGYCTAGEDAALRSLISSALQSIPSMGTVAEIASLKESLSLALSNYMIVGLSKYEVQVNELLANSVFSQPPYVAGTYPESSRSILTGIIATISEAKEKAGVYTAEQYAAMYSQIERDIEQFNATKVESSGEEEEPKEDLLEGEIVYVYLSNGDVDAYQLAALDGDYYVEKGTVYFPLTGGDTNYYTKAEYDSISTVMPALPTMTSFKFNNKYNPTLNVDVECAEITNDINLSVNAIGKWLTASFQLSDDKAVAYVDTVLQVSKETTQSFAKSVSYNVTYLGYNIIKNIKVQDEIWSTPTVSGGIEEVKLTADMLSTNKPSTDSRESLASLLDGNSSTIFHSTWGTANNATVNVNAYIEIALPEQLENIQLYYKCRPQSGYNPLIWEVYASNNGSSWKLVRTLDYIADGMPRGGYGQEYTSPTISLGGKYSYLRIVQTAGEYSKNHLALSELRVYKVTEETTGEPVKIQDAVYENRRVPFGNVYKVTVDWLTDRIASVPRIDIDIEGGQMVSSKDYYLDAKFRITGNGVYDNFEDSVQIKGRGNSSWSSNPYSKNPYRLKFAEKVKPFGLTKGKSWVLLANSQEGSLMANAIAMKIGQMAGAKYTNHIIPVELYINGSYRGSYMFTEKVGMANNSVDIDEEDGYVVELDTYSSADEPIYTQGQYSLPVKVAEPDLAEMEDTELAIARRAAILEDSREMQTAVYTGKGLESVLDVDATARFFLTNDLVLNQEINHPKSTYYHKNESDPEGKIAFGPLWDFDWGFNYENSRQYCYSGTTSSVIRTSMKAYRFWQDLTNVEIFKKHYYKVWKEFVESNSIAELKDYIDSYYNFARTSFENNAYEWGYSFGFSESDRDRAKQWVADRANYIYNNLDRYDIDDLIYTMPGDVNLNNQLTVHDVAVITAYLQGNEYKRFSEAKADANIDGYIDLADAEEVASMVMMSDAPSALYANATPYAAGELYGNDIVLSLGEECVLPLNLMCYDGEDYTALQFDIRVNEEVFIDDVVADGTLASHNLSFEMLDMNTYRVIIYSEENETFNAYDDVIVNIAASTFSVIDEDARAIEIMNIYGVNGDNDEVRFNDLRIDFSQSTGISDAYATYSVKGGDCITVTALEAQDVAVYSVDGRLLFEQNVAEGTTRIQLPAGVYVVNNKKVVVY
ncbi:MAG: CotH kinase family protein [Bacteroidaceae bacterium]|nr:CotH kinase family protein [Bacteroidaceae bacterium]